jgi:hypothetical protein
MLLCNLWEGFLPRLLERYDFYLHAREVLLTGVSLFCTELILVLCDLRKKVYFFLIMTRKGNWHGITAYEK